jgi:hypothetical protein
VLCLGGGGYVDAAYFLCALILKRTLLFLKYLIENLVGVSAFSNRKSHALCMACGGLVWLGGA